MIINKKDLLIYETSASWWAGYVSVDWLRNIMTKYLLIKINKKYKRYLDYLEYKKLSEEKTK